ncbi:MAG: aminotransferase class III-fold pyridoxal phosphate-dependent enzyme [Chloroflexi bacterium]|nr:aminotransferase class III-fold pyridoxal phosphate-dependent enzyme [Chloroflexota bacterium]
MPSIEETYVARTPGSAEIGPRAERVMPAGETRAAGYHRPYPLTLTHGAGARVWDVDGNEYVDLTYNFTSLVHGHGYAPIVEAAEKQIRGGTAWPARNPHQVELAEMLVDRVQSVEMVRFCNSGTEAAMLAMQVARHATGRKKVLMARYGYHGSHEVFEHGFMADTMGEWDHTLTAEFGNAESFEAVLSEQGDEIAAVFLESVMGSAGIVEGSKAFFDRVIAATHAAGAIFVLDEVITFRMSTGGQQKVLGITPDITMFGKLIGGGFPVGAIGGRRDLMRILDPREGKLFHSGTFNGNPVTTAAGVVSVRDLTSEKIAIMHGQAEELEAAFRKSAAKRNLPFSVRRSGSLMNLYFTEEPPRANLTRPDGRMMGKFHLAGMNHGLYFASRGMIVLATVLTDTDIAEIAQRADAAMADVAAEG